MELVKLREGVPARILLLNLCKLLRLGLFDSISFYCLCYSIDDKLDIVKRHEDEHHET